MTNEMFRLISSNDVSRLRNVLVENPKMANEGMALQDNVYSVRGHPLHRLCDAVFAKKITDEQAVAIAKILLEFGADIDGYKLSEDNNTPLIAAASLGAEKLGIFYIEQGADIDYAAPADGATALHWAAFCGKEMLVGRLIVMGANLNGRDRAYSATAADWAIHALITKDAGDLCRRSACVKLLLKAGTDQSLLNPASFSYLQSEAKTDLELAELIR